MLLTKMEVSQSEMKMMILN